MKLTEETIENAQYEGHFTVGKNGRKRWSRHIIWDDDLPALGVRISSRGKKSYVGAYRSGGRKRTKTLGKVGELTIEEARWRAVELGLEPSAPEAGASGAPASTPRAQARASQAPAVATEAPPEATEAPPEASEASEAPAEATEAPAVASEAPAVAAEAPAAPCLRPPAQRLENVADLARAYLERHLKHLGKPLGAQQRLITGNIIPVVGRIPLAKVKPSDVWKLRSRLAGTFQGDKKKLSALVTGMFAWAESEGLWNRPEGEAPETAPPEEAPRQEGRPAVASDGPNAEPAAAPAGPMRQRAELADRLEEAAGRGAEATDELEELRAAHRELEAELEAERERFERQRAEWASRAKQPDAWPVEARRITDNLRQSVDQLMTSLNESESAREELSRRLKASSEKEQARAHEVAALTRERELQEAELERARTRSRDRNVAPIALSAVAGAILGALLTFFLPGSPETRPSPDPGTEPEVVASGPSGEEAATRAPEPDPAPAAPPRVEADPASGSTDPVAVGEIEAPTAEAAEPDVSAAEETVQAWAAAWSGQRVDEYLSFYSSEFRPPGGMERGAWESQRRTRILRPRTISVSLGTMSSTILEPERVRVVFDQGYQTESYRDEVRKTIELAWEDDRWRIVGERSD